MFWLERRLGAGRCGTTATQNGHSGFSLISVFKYPCILKVIKNISVFQDFNIRVKMLKTFCWKGFWVENYTNTFRFIQILYNTLKCRFCIYHCYIQGECVSTATLKIFLPYGDAKRLHTAELSNGKGKTTGQSGGAVL